ncbi:MAG: RNA 2',3'-cyclic phosphodiesterase [Anaerolineales bacterium]|nr:MAG: RNA 2',3'-cyclic phosphodiesterase [Anaerolineales bacterium]
MRAFIAFELPENVLAALAAVSADLQRSLPTTALRWVPVSNMHLTLKFLGETQPEQASAISASLQRLGDTYSAMPVSLEGLGAFPNLRSPRVVWVGLQAPAALAQLAAEVDDAMHALGFGREARAFTPHLTLARVRREAQPRQLAGLQSALAQQAVPAASGVLEQLVLFESQLKPSGAVYNSLARIELRTKG